MPDAAETRKKELREAIARNRALLARRRESRSRALRLARRLRGRIHRTKNRVEELVKELRDLREGRFKAVRVALGDVGKVYEQPAYSNRGPKIDGWGIATGTGTGVPWCQNACNGWLRSAGHQQLRSGYTVAVVQWARERRYGLSIVPLSEARRGDMIYFKFPGVSGDFCDHVGLCAGRDKNGQIRTVEGNTSPGSSGSQNNGGGVYLRRRPHSQMVAVVRPSYSEVS